MASGPTTPSPGPGYTWVPGQVWGDDSSTSTPGQWALMPGYVDPVTPAANTVGGPNAAINANWKPPQPIQNQLNELLTNPVSGYSPNANYGNQYGQTGFGRFMFSGTAPVPQTAPYGWGRYPGVDGSPPSAPWLAGQTMPPPQWYHGAGAGTGGGGGGGGGTGGGVPPPTVTPPPSTGGNNGGWTPNGPPPSWTNTTGQWSGAGLSPAMLQAHQAQRQARGAAASAGENIPRNTTPVDYNAVYQQLGITDPNVWKASYDPGNAAQSLQGTQWSPGDFANTGPGSLSAWQQNWNALPPALRMYYGKALDSGGSSAGLLRQIYEAEGHSTAAGADLVNSQRYGGVTNKIENGQLVQLRKNSDGTTQRIVLANLLNPQAPRRVGSL